MHAKSHLAILIGAVLASSPVIAETVTTETDEHMIVSGRDYGFKADTNTTAMKIEATQLETPGQVSVIDETLIDEQRASTLGEVLKNDSSVSAGSTATNREKFLLRGFELQSSSGYLRDGNPHWSHYRQPIELLERVEVLKGPAGLLYGKSAPGGLVNMISKKPTHNTQVTVSQDIGSNDYQRTMADVSGSLNDDQTLRGRVILSTENQNSWRTRFDGSDVETERFVGGVFVDYDLNDSVMLSAHYDRTDEQGDLDNGSKVDANGNVIDPKVVKDQHWAETDNDIANYGVNVQAHLSDSWSVHAGVNRQFYERRRTESDIHLDGSAYNSSDRHDEWTFDTANVDFVGDVDGLGVNHRLLAGVNGLHYDYKVESFSTKSCASDLTACENGFEKPSDLNYANDDTLSHSKSQHYGLYLQDLVTFNEQWQVLAGLRFAIDKTESSKGKKDDHNNVLPKLGVIYHPADNGSIYAMYSESFEPVGEITNTNDINVGAEQDPVKGYLYELGSKWELLDDKLFVSGALFQITQENIQVKEDITDPTFKTRTTQAGEQVHKGAELSATGLITESLSLSGSMTYLDAEINDPFDLDIDGKRPAEVAEFSASIWTRYQIQPRTSLNLGAVHVGDRYGDDKNTFEKDAYTRVDAGVAHNLKYNEDLEFVFRANVENLFDKDYLAGGSASRVVVGAPRSYKATLQIKY